MPYLGLAELRVLLYIVRRTWGFKRDADTISLNQMVNGHRGRDGEQLDRGVNLSRRGISQALASLEEKRLIIRRRQQSAERGNEATLYALHVAGHPFP